MHNLRNPCFGAIISSTRVYPFVSVGRPPLLTGTSQRTGGNTGTEVVHGGPAVMNPMMRMAHGAQLEEWFYSNQALIESFQTFYHGFEAEED